MPATNSELATHPRQRWTHLLNLLDAAASMPIDPANASIAADYTQRRKRLLERLRVISGTPARDNAGIAASDQEFWATVLNDVDALADGGYTPPENEAPTVATPLSATDNGNLTAVLAWAFADAAGAVTSILSKVSGPGSVSFSPESGSDITASTATFSEAGEYVLRVTGTDEGGLSVTTEAGVEIAEPQEAAAIASHAITWTLEAEAESGQYVNGDPWLIGDVVIPSIIPASVADESNPLWIKHGTQVNPGVNAGQGYDSSAGGFDGGWNAALNVAPSITGVPLEVAPGSSVVSTQSVAAIGANTRRPQLLNASVLTVVDSAPADGSFRPSPHSLDKTPPANYSQLDFSFLPRLPVPEGHVVNYAAVERYFERYWSEQLPADDRGRYLHAANNQREYGTWSTEQIGTGMMYLLFDFPDETKARLLTLMVQTGLDLWGAIQGGQTFPDNGGLNSGRKPLLLLTGIALNHTAILAHCAQNNVFHEDRQTFYITQADVDRARHTADGRQRDPYTSDMIGLPEWGEKHASQPSRDGANWNVFYRQINNATWVAPALFFRLITDGMARWNHPVYFEYMDRWWEHQGQYLISNSTNYVPVLHAAMWNAYRHSTEPENPDEPAADSTDWLTGAVAFGPDDNPTSGGRVYSVTLPTVPDSEWAMVGIFKAPAQSGNFREMLLSSAGFGTGSGGDEWGFFIPTVEFATESQRRRLRAQIRRTSQTAAASGTSTTSAVIEPGKSYLFAYQRTAAGNMELWLSELDGTPSLEDSRAYNTSFGARTLTAGQFGLRYRGLWQAFYMASRALTDSEITQIAAGVNPDTIVASENRLFGVDFKAADSTLPNRWGAGSITRSGDWTNRQPSSPLRRKPGAKALRMAEPKIYLPFPIGFSGHTATALLSGTYHNYSGAAPAALQYRLILLADGSTLKDWTDLTSLVAAGGEWSGTAEFPESGEFVIQLRDKNDTAVVYRSATPVLAAATHITTGQSPYVRLNSIGAGSVALTGKLYRWSNSLQEWIRCATADTGSGFAAMANRFATVSGGKALAVIPTAVVGTSAESWAGARTLTLNSAATYTVGETVEIRNVSDNALRGTAKVRASAGTTSLQIQEADFNILGGSVHQVVGLTSGLTRTITAVDAFGVDVQATWVTARQIIANSGVRNAPVYAGWLQGASNVGRGGMGDLLDIIWGRINTDLSPLSLTPYLGLMPHNRGGDTPSAGANDTARRQQRTWVEGHALYGSRLFRGPSYQDMAKSDEQAATAQGGTSNTITLAATFESAADEISGITLTGGAGAGPTDYSVTSYNPSTKVATISGTFLAGTPDSTTTYKTRGSSQHQTAAGAAEMGARLGQDIAYRYGHGSQSGQGPVITAATKPSDGDGTAIKITVTHAQGTALRTPNGGTSASNVYGFEGWTGAAWIRSLTGVIVNATQVDLTFAQPVTSIRYAYGTPTPTEAWERLDDGLYDDSGIGSKGGLPVWFTQTDVPVTTA